VAGNKAVGIPGADLALAYDRLEPAWFKKFLHNPQAFKPMTRMPQFWVEGQTIFPELAGGNAERQIESIWAYLSLRKSMPLPEGITPVGSVGMELVPASHAIVHRTFMKDVGPRSILAGYPEKVHVAFDANQVRLAQAWRGRFFDASGTASARTDKFLEPLGEDVVTFPPGPAFAQLPDEKQPWPVGERTARNLGGQFKGYTLDALDRPTFRYQLGNVLIEETPLPVPRPGGAVLSRQFRLQKSDQSSSAQTLYLRAAVGPEISQTGEFFTAGNLQVKIEGATRVNGIIRQTDGTKELLFPVEVGSSPVEFNLVVQW
jgi:hypothetical protein